MLDGFGLFQSPHEDSFFSDVIITQTAYLLNLFQSPHEDSFFSDVIITQTAYLLNLFQSPHEDSFFSDGLMRESLRRFLLSFNPLTRIRSSLTYLVAGGIATGAR